MKNTEEHYGSPDASGAGCILVAVAVLVIGAVMAGLITVARHVHVVWR